MVFYADKDFQNRALIKSLKPSQNNSHKKIIKKQTLSKLIRSVQNIYYLVASAPTELESLACPLCSYL